MRVGRKVGFEVRSAISSSQLDDETLVSQNTEVPIDRSQGDRRQGVSDLFKDHICSRMLLRLFDGFVNHFALSGFTSVS